MFNLTSTNNLFSFVTNDIFVSISTEWNTKQKLFLSIESVFKIGKHVRETKLKTSLFLFFETLIATVLKLIYETF